MQSITEENAHFTLSHADIGVVTTEFRVHTHIFLYIWCLFEKTHTMSQRNAAPIVEEMCCLLVVLFVFISLRTHIQYVHTLWQRSSPKCCCCSPPTTKDMSSLYGISHHQNKLIFYKLQSRVVYSYMTHQLTSSWNKKKIQKSGRRKRTIHTV